MPRLPRYEDCGAIHHAVTQGTGRGHIVRDDHDRRAYLGRFYREAASRGWLVHASSLLDTHHHAVITTPSPDLGIGVGRIAGGHAAWFNARHGRSGALFTERFWSRRVESHLVRACTYVFVNPVAAGMVDHPRDWRWSRYADVERRGCSPDIAAVTGGTDAFLRRWRTRSSGFAHNGPPMHARASASSARCW